MRRIFKFKAGDEVIHKETRQEFTIVGLDNNHYRMKVRGSDGPGGLSSIIETEKYFEIQSFERKKLLFDKD